ncbi:MAG: L-2-amino-thiazoline-4-carboxylic acid hydrolase [Clostridia bacterium]|nr:L-2-amino-thiazoline-4-carboxylic acid hydrolase [Clostridia bacterium]
MKYIGMPMGMWWLLKWSFQKNMVTVLGFKESAAAQITKKAKPKYKEIIAKLPEFEKSDRFKMNLVNCAMFAAFYLHIPEKPTLMQATDFYGKAMMTGAVRWFCRMSEKQKFSEKDIQNMKDTAAFKAADRNPYSWNMDYFPYADGSGYEARFTKCGICTLMRELGIYEVVPAMCRLDYTMSEAGGASEFVREYTLASGGPYCDCGYKKKGKVK